MHSTTASLSSFFDSGAHSPFLLSLVGCYCYRGYKFEIRTRVAKRLELKSECTLGQLEGQQVLSCYSQVRIKLRVQSSEYTSGGLCECLSAVEGTGKSKGRD